MEKEVLKEISGFNDYFVSNLGNVYSLKTGKLKQLKPFIDSKGNYLMIRLINNEGIRCGLLIHRIVATAFILNPNNLPEVNHKNKNKQDSRVENLEWCSRKDNLRDSYTTMSPVRNKNKCKLYKDNIFVNEFETIKDAAMYAEEKFNAKKVC